MHMFRLTQSYLNSLVKPRIFFRFSEKKINFMHFERRTSFKMHEIIFFPEKNYSVPILLKIFRPVTRNTLNFLIWPRLPSLHVLKYPMFPFRGLILFGVDPIGNSMTLSCVQGKTSGQIGDVTLGHDEDLNWIL